MLQRRYARSMLACALLGLVPQVFAASFTVTGSDTVAKTLDPAAGATQTGTIDAAGDLNVSGGTNAITVTGGSGTRTVVIDNSGKIRQTGSGRAIRNNSGAAATSITNRAGATISSVGDDVIQVSTAGSTFSLDNTGTISTASGRAVNLRDIGGSNTINNFAGGILRSTAGDAVRPGVNGVINNAGLIEAVTRLKTTAAVTEADSDDGIQADITGVLPVTGVGVTNTGTISGRHGITGGAGTTADFTITVLNQATGKITGVNGSGINIDNVGNFRGNATVTNYGNIVGNFDSTRFNTGDGDGVDVDGILTLFNYGIIRGTGADGLGSDGGPNNPEGVSIGGGSITNYAGAEISGQETTGVGRKGHGVLVDNSSGGDAFTSTIISNAGLIRGYDSYAIRFIGNLADTITNSAGGKIQGGGNAVEGAAIQTGDGADTLSNSGIIVGDNGLAIDLEAGNDTLHILGGSISGDVSGGAGMNSLDFDTGASFTYGGVLSNFASVEIKSGSVTLSGINTYSGNTTVTAGSLLATNASGSATGTGTVIVKSGAKLGGTGTVGAVTAEAGSTIAPGASPGTLTVGSLAITTGSKFSLEVGMVSDRLNVTGALSFSGSGTATIDVLNNGIVPGTDYTLIGFGSASGFTAGNIALGSLPSGVQATLEVKAGSVVLHVKADTTPNNFSFTDQTGVPRNSVRTSNAVTITGIDSPAQISVVGGSYSIGCTATFVSGTGTISNNQTVCVRHTASPSYNTAVNTSLNVGGVTDTFTSTTPASALVELLTGLAEQLRGVISGVLGALGGGRR